MIQKIKSLFSNLALDSKNQEILRLRRKVNKYRERLVRYELEETYLKKYDTLLRKVYKFPSLESMLEYTKLRAALNIETMKHVQYKTYEAMTPTEVTELERQLRNQVFDFEKRHLTDVLEASNIVVENL